jgi:hypothetical protein
MYIYMCPIMICSYFVKNFISMYFIPKTPNGEPCHVSRHKTVTTQNQLSNIHIIHKIIAQAQQNPICFPKPDNCITSITSLNLHLLCSYRD